MSVNAYAIWRLKEGVNIKYDELEWFSPGGFTFTNKTNDHLSFDFEDYDTDYNEESRLIYSDLFCIEDEFITESLALDGLSKLIQDEYDISFFENGKIDLDSLEDEMFCCMDLTIDGTLHSQVDFTKYIEPAYLAVYNSNRTKVIELLNNLTSTEQKQESLIQI